MKLIERGMYVHSPYFGYGYIVRTLKDMSSGKKYIVIRVIIDKNILFCLYPDSVNRLFFLPHEFDQNPDNETSIYSLGRHWKRDVTDKYHPDHKYLELSLAWKKRKDPEYINSIIATGPSPIHQIDPAALVDFNLEDI